MTLSKKHVRIVMVSIVLLVAVGCVVFTKFSQLDCCVFLVSPVPYQVFQRDWTTNTGHIHIVVDAAEMGNVLPVEVKWGDDRSHYLELGRTDIPCANHASYEINCVRYTGDLTDVPSGQSLFQLRLNQPLRNALMPNSWINAAHVGVGDVFVLAGQSNSVGYAVNLQSYTSDRFVASMYTRQGEWAELDDFKLNFTNGLRPGFWPTIHTNYGSPWPRLATLLSAYTQSPVAFIPTGIGGLEIKGWSADFYVYPFIADQVENTGAHPALLLWQQGESDIYAEVGYEAYKSSLLNLAERSYADMNLSLVASLVGPIPNANADALEGIRQAVQDATAESDYILPGPDFMDQSLTVDGLHFQTDEEVAYFAEKWFEALKGVGLPGA